MKIFLNYKKANVLALLTILLVSIAFISCNKDTSTANNNSIGTFVAIVNASQVSVPEDIYFDGVKTNYTIAYGQTTGYLSSLINTHIIWFNSSSSFNTNKADTVTLDAGNFYTVYFGDGNSSVNVQEDRTLPQAGKARISFINLSLNVTSAVDFGITGGNKVISGLPVKTASGYYDVDATTASFSLNATGSGTILLNMPVTLQAGHIYTIFISGTPSKPLEYHVLAQNP